MVLPLGFSYTSRSGGGYLVRWRGWVIGFAWSDAGAVELAWDYVRTRRFAMAWGGA